MKPAAFLAPTAPRPRAWPGAILLLFLAVPALAQHPGGHVMGNGGGPTAGGAFVLNGTLGQPVVGASAGAALVLCHGFWCLGGVRVLDAGPPAPGLPATLAVGPAFPNPARDAVSFALSLPQAAEVRLAVFDVAGRPVGAAVTRAFDAGWQRLEWRVPRARSGVYFARLHVNGQPAGERRVVLAR